MRKRPITKTRPDLEQLEEKRPLSVGASAPSPPASPGDVPESLKARAVLARQDALAKREESGQAANADPVISARGAPRPHFGFLVFRLTNPDHYSNKLIPPFAGHVLVQAKQPVPGQVYNVLSMVMRNGTAQTFDASSGFTVTFPGQSTPTPILTGNEQWQPGQEFVFYVLTKKYYPLPSEVTSGFVFNLGGAKSTAIPGPSGIFLRLTYNPNTIDRVLDSIIAFGQGAQGGAGPRTGIADTQIYSFVSAKTNRNDFGGYF